MFILQPKITRHAKTQESVTHKQEQRQSIEIDSQWSQVLNLANQNFKSVITNMFKELKKV